MKDRILEAFLERQFEEATSLANASDILDLVPEAVKPPQRYVARFRCAGLVRQQNGAVAESSQFEVGIWLPDDYLRRVDPSHVVTVFRPWNTWHPNIAGPIVCLGHLVAGTRLVDILFQCYEILSYQKWAAHDGLNPAACEWARNNQERFPVDRRPLKRGSGEAGRGGAR